VVAFELARALRRAKILPPIHLFVAGRPAPHLPIRPTRVGDLTLDGFRALLSRLGGTPEEILADSNVLTRFKPLITADFAVNEGYRYRPEAPLDVPITAFVATDDSSSQQEAMTPWRDHTTGTFRVQTLPGDHAAVLVRTAEVHTRIASAIAPSTSL
jgi:medium-chain acyl-[acyl-carrier-protein] hydrolase